MKLHIHIHSSGVRQ